jgi:hypothetical protein
MTTTEKLKITMSERRPLSIVKADWPRVAHGEAHSGQYDFQAFDGARISVRQHADGRTIVYGFAGDWEGGGRPERENREAGYLLAADDDVVRAIHRVAGVLAGTGCVGEMAHTAARRCIADLPDEEVDVPAGEPVTMPAEGARRLLRILDEVASSGPTGIDPRHAKDLAAVADELRAVVSG